METNFWYVAIIIAVGGVIVHVVAKMREAKRFSEWVEEQDRKHAEYLSSKK